jgi:hypothetical protein
MSEEPKFETWAIVEIMGHSRYAGYLSEQAVGGCSFVRVDVPEIVASNDHDARPAFTKLFGQASVFCITPCTEATAREAAKSFRSRAMQMFELPMARQLPYADHDDEDDEHY